MGKWSKRVAQKFLFWLKDHNDIHYKRWLDVGCGTGALSFEIIESTKPEIVLGIDPSSEYLPNGNLPHNLSFKIGNSMQIPGESNYFDFVVSGLALNFMPNKIESLWEMIRVLKPGGTLALYVWDYSEQMEFLRFFWDAAVQINPTALSLDEGVIFPICKKPALVELFTNCQLKDILIHEIVIQTNFSNFDAYWNPFLGGQGPAGSYVEKLSEQEKKALQDKICKNLRLASDEAIRMKARAYAIKGKK